MTWQEAYAKWVKLADRGYGERCYTPAQMERVDKRIRNAMDLYMRLLSEEKSRNLLDKPRNVS